MEKEYVERMVEIEQRSKSNTKRLDEHDREISKLSEFYIALTKTNDKVDKIEENVTEIKQDIKEIKDKPGKKIDQLWGYIISAIIGGLIGYIYLKLGLK